MSTTEPDRTPFETWLLAQTEDHPDATPIEALERAADLIGDLRRALQPVLKHCRCDGGLISIREYDGASGRCEGTGRYERCVICWPVRAVLKKLAGTPGAAP